MATRAIGPRNPYPALCPMLLLVVSPLLLWSCSPAADSEFEHLQERLLEGSYSEFKIIDVSLEADGGLVRVNVTLTPPPERPSEVERRTRNALSEIQLAVGTERRLAVWSYPRESLTPDGMAFYSALASTVHFKTGSELQ